MKTDTVRNQRVLTRMYWREGKTLQDIGDMLGLTRERVRQIFVELGIPTAGKHKHLRSILNELKRDNGFIAFVSDQDGNKYSVPMHKIDDGIYEGEFIAQNGHGE